MKVFNAKDIVEANYIINYLKDAGIIAYCMDSGLAPRTHGVPGFGVFGVDVYVDDSDAKRAAEVLKKIPDEG